MLLRSVFEKTRSLSVLVVDDSQYQRLVLRRLLERHGHTVIEAPDGERALTALAEQLPDIILLDIHLPGRDGLGVLKELREQHTTLPVIIITADDDVETAMKAQRLSTFAYVHKPYDDATLLALITDAIS